MKAPMAWIVLPMTAGILLADTLPFMNAWTALCGAILPVALYGWLTLRRSGSGNSLWWPRAAVLCGAMAMAGYGLYAGRVGELRKDHYTRFGGNCFCGVIGEPPAAGRNCYKVVLDLDMIEQNSGTWRQCSGRLMCFVQKSEAAAALRKGDRLSARARIQIPADSVGEDGFDYRRYLHRKGIERQCYIDSLSMVVEASSRGSDWFDKLRRKMLDDIRSTTLTARQQGIAEAILLGWDEDIDDTTRRRFQQAGIAHLLCVSGLHVGIVAWLAGLLFAWAGRRRGPMMAKSVLQVAAVWFFVMLTGAAPSAMRAGLMFSLLIAGHNLCDSHNLYNNLCLSAMVLLLINPGVLFAVGFQLSYSAVLGIAAAQPLMAPRFLMATHGKQTLWRKAALWLWQLACVSIAAQLATAPLVLYYFHSLPLYFLVANIAVMPFAGLLLGTLMVMTLLAGAGLPHSVPTWLAAQELRGIEAVTSWVGSLPYATVEGVYCTLAMTWLLEAVLAATAVIIARWQRATD